MKYIMGTKIGMTRIFDEKGLEIPVTVLKVDSCWIVGKKIVDRDGYNALQLGYGCMNEKKVVKPYRGIFKNVNEGKVPKYVREYRLNHDDKFNLGQEIKVDVFAAGNYVDVTGVSIGKGFAGAMKRHGFSGLPASHGHGEYRRAPGSMSASSYPSRVFKGKKLPGHMGARRVTIQHLEVVKVDSSENLILLRGAIPGTRGSIVSIKETVKNLKTKKV